MMMIDGERKQWYLQHRKTLGNTIYGMHCKRYNIHGSYRQK